MTATYIYTNTITNKGVPSDKKRNALAIPEK